MLHRPSRKPPWRNQNVKRRALSNNLQNQGVINIISRGATNRESNRARKAYSRWLKSYAVGARCRVEEDLIISFEPTDLEGVTTPHEEVLVIWATIVNYNMVQVFVDSRSSVNILFKEAFDQIQMNLTKLKDTFAYNVILRRLQ